MFIKADNREVHRGRLNPSLTDGCNGNHLAGDDGLVVAFDPPDEPVTVCDMPYTLCPTITADGKRTAYLDRENLVVLDIQTHKLIAKRHLGKWPGLLAEWSPDTFLPTIFTPKLDFFANLRPNPAYHHRGRLVGLRTIVDKSAGGVAK
ncbi:MAG: hypothetical protein ACLQNE_45400 [Thermoguttaceae bacterium]